MSKKEILSWFDANGASLTASRIMLVLAIGLVIGIMIYITYQVTYSGVNYSVKFNSSNVVILLITIVIMLMISSNIVISLGMVGALSIVRFRTAVKDPRDTVFIFWSIVEGLCVGSQNFKLALISTMVVTIVLLIFSYVGKKGTNYLLIIRGTGESINHEEIEECIDKYASKSRLRTMNRTENTTEMIYELKAKKGLDTEIVNELKEIQNVISINWLLETGENVG